LFRHGQLLDSKDLKTGKEIISSPAKSKVQFKYNHPPSPNVFVLRTAIPPIAAPCGNGNVGRWEKIFKPRTASIFFIIKKTDTLTDAWPVDSRWTFLYKKRIVARPLRPHRQITAPLLIASAPVSSSTEEENEDTIASGLDGPSPKHRLQKNASGLF
jgi:hypothetical protein